MGNIKRQTIIIIENNEIGDDLWNPLVVKTLRNIADHEEKTKGNGRYPISLSFPGGDVATVIHAGTVLPGKI